MSAHSSAEYMREWEKEHREERKAYKRQYRLDHAEEIVEYKRDYYHRDIERSRESVRERYQRQRDERAANRRKERALYPEKHRARDALKYAVRMGYVKRQPCEVCGETRTHGHHDDYAERLKVRWLCAYHHKQVHRKARPT